MSIFPSVGIRLPWTPTVSASGAMTVTGLTVDHAYYAIVGGLCFFDFRILFTLGGVANSQVFISMPVTPIQTTGSMAYVVTNNNGGGNTLGRGAIQYASNRLASFIDPPANWNLVASIAIGQGFYFIS